MGIFWGIIGTAYNKTYINLINKIYIKYQQNNKVFIFLNYLK